MRMNTLNQIEEIEKEEVKWLLKAQNEHEIFFLTVVERLYCNKK